MPVMDEFREEREAMKQKSFKEKIQYFCDYYKWHVIGAAALIAFVISMIYSVATRKEWAFYGAFINAYQTPDYNAFCDDFAQYADIDLRKYDVMLDSNIYITDSVYDPGNVDTMERLMVYIAAGDMDVMVSGPKIINRYAYYDTFQDLRQILPQDLQTQLEPYYYYMDLALADEFDALQESGETSNVPPYPADPSSPEGMENPVPVGLYVQDCPRIQDAFIFQEDEVILGVAGNVSQTDTILAFIRMIYDI